MVKINMKFNKKERTVELTDPTDGAEQKIVLSYEQAMSVSEVIRRCLENLFDITPSA